MFSSHFSIVLKVGNKYYIIELSKSIEGCFENTPCSLIVGGDNASFVTPVSFEMAPESKKVVKIQEKSKNIYSTVCLKMRDFCPDWLNYRVKN